MLRNFCLLVQYNLLLTKLWFRQCLWGECTMVLGGFLLEEGSSAGSTAALAAEMLLLCVLKERTQHIATQPIPKKSLDMKTKES